MTFSTEKCCSIYRYVDTFICMCSKKVQLKQIYFWLCVNHKEEKG